MPASSLSPAFAHLTSSQQAALSLLLDSSMDSKPRRCPSSSAALLENYKLRYPMVNERRSSAEDPPWPDSPFRADETLFSPMQRHCPRELLAQILLACEGSVSSPKALIAHLNRLIDVPGSHVIKASSPTRTKPDSLVRANITRAAIGSQAHGPPGANVFVFHIPNEWDENDLAIKFAQYGMVLSARIATDKAVGRRLGFGFVSYTDIASACAAVAALDGYSVAGKRLKVTIKRGEQQYAAALLREQRCSSKAPSLETAENPPAKRYIPKEPFETKDWTPFQVKAFPDPAVPHGSTEARKLHGLIGLWDTTSSDEVIDSSADEQWKQPAEVPGRLRSGESLLDTHGKSNTTITGDSPDNDDSSCKNSSCKTLVLPSGEQCTADAEQPHNGGGSSVASTEKDVKAKECNCCHEQSENMNEIESVFTRLLHKLDSSPPASENDEHWLQSLTSLLRAPQGRHFIFTLMKAAGLLAHSD